MSERVNVTVDGVAVEVEQLQRPIGESTLLRVHAHAALILSSLLLRVEGLRRAGALGARHFDGW